MIKAYHENNSICFLCHFPGMLQILSAVPDHFRIRKDFIEAVHGSFYIGREYPA